MNHRPTDEREAREPAPVDEREWALQEQALEDERLDRPPVGDARRLRYRVLARRLRTPPDAALPSNFAWETAHAVEQRVRSEARAFARFRRRLYVALALVYGLCAAIMLALQGREWLTLLQGADARTLRWPVALLVCIGLSLLLPHARRARRG